MKEIRKRLINIENTVYNDTPLDREQLEYKIKSLLVSDGEENKLDIDAFSNEEKQKRLEFALSKPVNQNYLEFILYVNDVINRRYNLKNSNYIDSWEEAYLEFLQNRKNINLNSRLFELENLLVNSINFFKDYKIRTANGKVIINNTIKQISNNINKMIIKVGPENILNDIFKNQLKRNIYKRFNLAKKITMTGFKELALPFNYLINLSIKNLDLKVNKITTFNKKDLDELYKTAKNYLALFQLQDFHVFSSMSLANFSLENLHRELSYDSIFRFDQISDDNIIRVIKNLFTNIDYTDMKSKLGFDLKEYLFLVEKIIKFAPHAGQMHLLFNLFNQNELKILDLISHSQKLNPKYVLPTDAQALTFSKKPLIKFDNYYLLIDLNYCAWSFYEVLLELLASKKVNTTRKEAKRIHANIGFNIEDFLIKEFIDKNLNIHYGNYTNDNECDIVIEDTIRNTLVFIEIKKRKFTYESKSGDLNYLALDFIESFVYAMNQTYRHEYYLEKNGEMNFTKGSKTKIIYSNQKIERLAVTLYDFQSLTQNPMALIEWFSSLDFRINDSFVPSSYQEKKILKSFINAKKQLDKLRKNLKLINSLQEDYRTKRMNTKLVSLEYILFLLQYVNEDRSFFDVLTFNKQIMTGTADLYSEFLSYKALREKNT